MRETGIYQKLGNWDHFIPNPLSPHPPLNMNPQITLLYGEASFALGQLSEMAQRLPDPKRFIKAYMIKEALLSSAIEGIQTTLMNVFTHPLKDSKPNKNTQLVLNYTNALDTTLQMLLEEKFPLAIRVILKAHEVLMSTGEGEKATPGQFRKQSVRVGNLIPPPPPLVPSLMSKLEKYMNKTSDLPPLINAGLIHVYFRECRQ